MQGAQCMAAAAFTPDEKIAALKNNKFEDEMLIHYAFSDFSRHYMATHTVRPGHDGGRGDAAGVQGTF